MAVDLSDFKILTPLNKCVFDNCGNGREREGV